MYFLKVLFYFINLLLRLFCSVCHKIYRSIINAEINALHEEKRNFLLVLYPDLCSNFSMVHTHHAGLYDEDHTTGRDRW